MALNSQRRPWSRTVWVITVGGALVVLGSLLPWVSFVSPFGSMGQNGMSGSGDGIWMLFIGIAMLSLGIALIRGSSLPRLLLLTPIAAGAIVIVLGILDFREIQDQIDAYDSLAGGFTGMETGAGLPTIIVGGLLLTAGGLTFLKPGPLPARNTRECPFCKSEIRADASVCPHCQRESEPTAAAGRHSLRL